MNIIPYNTSKINTQNIFSSFNIFPAFLLTVMENYLIIMKKPKEVHHMKYVCDVCGWEYDEEQGAPEYGIAPGTKFEDLPDDFSCPLCGVGKDSFSAQ